MQCGADAAHHLQLAARHATPLLVATDYSGLQVSASRPSGDGGAVTLSQTDTWSWGSRSLTLQSRESCSEPRSSPLPVGRSMQWRCCTRGRF